jgi:hypothetical protein
VDRLHAGRLGAAGEEALARVYEWFTKGLGTHDLVEARRLLTQLDAA